MRPPETSDSCRLSEAIRYTTRIEEAHEIETLRSYRYRSCRNGCAGLVSDVSFPGDGRRLRPCGLGLRSAVHAASGSGLYPARRQWQYRPSFRLSREGCRPELLGDVVPTVPQGN